MKNFIKNMSRMLVFLMIIPIMSLSLVACKKNNENPDVPPSPPEQNLPQEVDDNPNSPIKSGIYRFEKELSLDDKFFLSEEKVIEHFKTQDLNGVNRKILELGFIEFAQSITSINNLPKNVEFNSKNEVTTYKVDNSVFSSLDKFTYSFNSESSTFKTEKSTNPAISYDFENNEVYLLYPFTYESNGKTVQSPLYIKTKLVYVCDSFETMTSNDTTKTFFYKVNSSKIVTSTSSTDLDKVNAKLAEIFKLKNTENILAEIETIMKNQKLTINNEFSLAVLHKTISGVLNFSFSSITNKVFNIGSNSISLIIDNFDSDLSEFNAYLTINDKSVLQFTFTKSIIKEPPFKFDPVKRPINFPILELKKDFILREPLEKESILDLEKESIKNFESLFNNNQKQPLI